MANFQNCKNITDVIVLLSEMERVGESIVTSDGTERSGSNVIKDLLVGVKEAGRIQRNSPTLLDGRLNKALQVIPIGQAELELRASVKRILVDAVTSDTPVFIPFEIAGALTKTSSNRLASEIRRVGDREVARNPIVNDHPKYSEVTSLNELVALIYERRETIGEGSEKMSYQELIQGIGDYVKAFRNGDVAAGLPAIPNREIISVMYQLDDEGDILSQHLLEAIAPTSEVSRELSGPNAKTIILDHGKSAPRETKRPVEPTMPEPTRRSNRGLALGAILALGGVATVTVCGGAGALYLKKKTGAEASDHDTGVTVPDGWVECTPEQFAKIEAQRAAVTKHELKSARYLIEHAKIGLTIDGQPSTDSHERVASFATDLAHVDFIFNLHKKDGDRIWCFDEEPIVKTDKLGHTIVEPTTVARMRNAGTLDDMSDDKMGFNMWWLNQDGLPPLSSSIWHEAAHAFTGGKKHDDGIAALDRWDKVFSSDVLTKHDYAYYISLNVDTPDLVVWAYLEQIKQDLKNHPNDDIATLREYYRIKPEGAEMWAGKMASTFIHDYDVLEPLGVDGSTLEGALKAGEMHEVANEWTKIYFDELAAEQSREQKQETQTETTKPLRIDAGHSWR